MTQKIVHNPGDRVGHFEIVRCKQLSTKVESFIVTC